MGQSGEENTHPHPLSPPPPPHHRNCVRVFVCVCVYVHVRISASSPNATISEGQRSPDYFGRDEKEEGVASPVPPAWLIELI